MLSAGACRPVRSDASVAPGKEGLPNSLGVTGMEDHIPEAAGDAISKLHSLACMVAKMVPLDVPEIGVSEIIEVDAMVKPLFPNITLNHAGQQNG